MATMTCHCKRFIALDGKDNETTPEHATGFVMHPEDRPVHRGRAPKAERALAEKVSAKMREAKQ